MDIFVFGIHNVLLSAKLKIKVNSLWFIFINSMNDSNVSLMNRWLPVLPHQEALSEPQWPWLTDHKIMHYMWRCSYLVKHYPWFLWKQYNQLDRFADSESELKWNQKYFEHLLSCPLWWMPKKKDKVSWNLMMGDEKVNATSQGASLQPAAHMSHESCFVLLQQLWQPGKHKQNPPKNHFRTEKCGFCHLL